MEKTILGSLEWYLTVPTQYVFLARFIKATNPDPEMEHMVHFLAELVSERSCFRYRTSCSEEQPIRKNEKIGASLSLTPNDDGDGDWPEEEDDVHDWAPMFTGNEDDVSFSDLEGYDE
ncbi:hypothetical protein DY000_02012576 [Brassica cretica]|nr:hypothetical protein DY000_02012576 [Brassica cretica]